MEFTKLNKTTVFKVISQALSSKFNAWQLSLGECDLCGNDSISQPLLCQYCLADLPIFNYQQCGDSLLNWPAIDRSFSKRKFDQLFCLSPYIWPIDQWLKQLKYHNRFELAVLLADLLVPLWQQKIMPLLQPDYAFTAVAVHPKKWQIRGYNQAHLIAKALTKKVHINYQDDLLIRTSFCAGQVGQSGAERRKNLKGAFEISPHITKLPEQIILLDDVLTTGTTVNEVSKLLKHRGVKKVIVLTLALSLPNNSRPIKIND